MITPRITTPSLRSIRSAKATGYALATFQVFAVALVTIGCAGYQLGPRTLFRSDVQTIHVPIVRNDTFRHDLGVRLTEAVIREIESRTPYKVTGDPNADSVLTIRVLTENKEVLTETAGDDPRALESHVAVQTAWVGRGGNMLMENRILPAEDLAMTFTNQTRFVPEAGQSIETALQEAINSLAERIVSQMEMRW